MILLAGFVSADSFIWQNCTGADVSVYLDGTEYTASCGSVSNIPFAVNGTTGTNPDTYYYNGAYDDENGIFQNSSTSVYSSSLQAVYHFGDAEDTYDMTFNGNPTNADGKIGNAVDFDGTGDNINLGNLNQSATTMTVMCWVNPDDVSDMDGIIGRWGTGGGSPDHSWILAANANVIRFKPRSGDVDNNLETTETIGIGSWHHIAVTYDSVAGTTIYINGTVTSVENDTTITGSLDQGTENVYIGTWNGSANFWVGGLDDCRIYDVVLTTSQIQDIASGHQKENVSSANLVFHSTMESLADSTSNNNDLTTAGNPVLTTGKYGKGFDFDGSGDYILTSYNPDDSTTSYTATAWVKSENTLADFQWVLATNNDNSNNGGWLLGLDRASPLCGNGVALAWTTDAGVGTSVSCGTTNITDGAFHHIALTYDVSTNAQKLYVDGILENSTTATDEDDYNQAVTIGSKGGGGGGYVNGNIDEVQIWDKVLSADEVLAVYNDSAWTLTENTIEITINSPANNTNSTDDLSVNFTATEPNSESMNCSIYLNGTLNNTIEVASGTTHLINVSDMETGQYEWYLECNTSTNSETSGTYQYYIDSTAPSCNFSSSIYPDIPENYTFNVVCTDEHFFSMNITCPNSNNSFNVIGLDVVQYNFTETFYFNETDTCSYEYCDGHTAYETSLEPSVLNNTLQIIKNGKEIGRIWVEDGSISVVKMRDRIRFSAKYTTKSPAKIVYYQAPADSIYMKSEDFRGWIVSYSTRTWLDMENSLNLPVMTIDHGNGLFEFRIVTAKSFIEFDSTGSLNCVSGTITVGDEYDYPIEPAVCPDSSTASVMLFALIVMFSCFLITLGLAFRLRFLGILGSIVLIPLSWTVIACHLFTGYVMFGAGATLLVWFVWKS